MFLLSDLSFYVHCNIKKNDDASLSPPFFSHYCSSPAWPSLTCTLYQLQTMFDKLISKAHRLNSDLVFGLSIRVFPARLCLDRRLTSVNLHLPQDALRISYSGTHLTNETRPHPLHTPPLSLFI